MRISYILLLFVLLFSLNACKKEYFPGLFYDDIYRVKYLNSHPELSEEIRQMILNEEIALGMTIDQVIASWGRPLDYSESYNSLGHTVTLYYRKYLGVHNTKDVYLIFRNDKLESISYY